MKNSIYLFYVLIAIKIVLISSCVSPKEVLYFQPIQKDTIFSDFVSTELQIEADDLLSITVSAEEYETVLPFNLPVVSSNLLDGRATGQPLIQNYRVNRAGNIVFPVLGELKLSGLTIEEARVLLIEKLKEYVNTPIVNISLMNFKITILGDVASPGSYQIKTERLTILEALGMAGDLNITGRRDNILVIREIKGDQVYSRIDITKSDFVHHPVYFLKQNDVIYIEPNENRMNTSSYSPWIGVVLSSLSVSATIINIIVK